MDTKKLISFRHVSEVLTGNKETIRGDRPNAKYSGPLNELFDFLEDWSSRNSKSKEVNITVKTKKSQ